jgi:hypothetical protein
MSVVIDIERLQFYGSHRHSYGCNFPHVYYSMRETSPDKFPRCCVFHLVSTSGSQLMAATGVVDKADVM